MGTEDVSVAFRSGHLNMGYDEAVDLRAKLDSAITRVEEARSGFRRPCVSDEGFMIRENFYDFFVQVYPDAALLRNRAGRLVSALVHAANSRSIPVKGFKVLCGTCKGHVSTPSCDGFRENHVYANTVEYFVCVASLKEHSGKLLEYLRASGRPAARKDLRLLLDFL